MQNSEIKQLLNKSEEELYIELAIAGTSGAIGFDPIDKGKEVFLNIVEGIKNDICSNQQVKKVAKDSTTFNSVTVVAAIADLIAQLALPVSPFTVAVLIVKVGLDKICKDF